jgi:hypothetical protein
MTGSVSLLMIAALCLSAVSAYYSIVGLAAIFHSAWLSVVILATVLEVCKLVLASWLYKNWHQTHGLLKSYLTCAVIVLMLITSMGIFGFLSKAHVEQDTVNQGTQLRLEQLDMQLGQRQQDLERIQRDLAQLDRSINIQLDANRAQTALAARRQQTAERDRLRAELETTQNQILGINQQRTATRQEQNNQMSKLGPLVYVAELFGMDGEDRTAVKWMIAILVLVCDPLAVLMIVAANSRMGRAEAVIPLGSLKWSETENSLVFWDGQSWKNTNFQVESTPIDQEQIMANLRQQWDHMFKQLSSMNANLNGDTAKLLDDKLMEFKTEWREQLDNHKTVDPDQMKQLIHSTLEEWLQGTLTVSYTADHTEIQSIVDKAIQQMTAKFRTNQRNFGQS